MGTRKINTLLHLIILKMFDYMEDLDEYDKDGTNN